MGKLRGTYVGVLGALESDKGETPRLFGVRVEHDGALQEAKKGVTIRGGRRYGWEQ